MLLQQPNFPTLNQKKFFFNLWNHKIDFDEYKKQKKHPTPNYYLFIYLLYFRDCGGIGLSTDSNELLNYVFWEETKTAKEKCSLIIGIFETNAKE